MGRHSSECRIRVIRVASSVRTTRSPSATATAGFIDAVTINGFDPSKDVIVMQQTLASTFSVHDDVHGNAVISFAGDNSDSITLVGVHASALHSSDFQLV
jgi:hypothetical protein